MDEWSTSSSDDTRSRATTALPSLNGRRRGETVYDIAFQWGTCAVLLLILDRVYAKKPDVSVTPKPEGMTA